MGTIPRRQILTSMFKWQASNGARKRKADRAVQLLLIYGETSKPRIIIQHRTIIIRKRRRIRQCKTWSSKWMGFQSTIFLTTTKTERQLWRSLSLIQWEAVWPKLSILGLFWVQKTLLQISIRISPKVTATCSKWCRLLVDSRTRYSTWVRMGQQSIWRETLVGAIAKSTEVHRTKLICQMQRLFSLKSTLSQLRQCLRTNVSRKQFKNLQNRYK